MEFKSQQRKKESSKQVGLNETPLKFLHVEQGIIHQNLKPSNILFKTGENGQVVTQIGDASLGKVLVSTVGDTQSQLYSHHLHININIGESKLEESE